MNVPSLTLALLGVILIYSLSSKLFWLAVLGTWRYVETFKSVVQSHCPLVYLCIGVYNTGIQCVCCTFRFKVCPLHDVPDFTEV